jgi:hypothetical protein
MYQAYEIEMDDGEKILIESDGRDIRAWEADQDKSLFRTPLSFTVVAQVAYLAGKRTGVLNGKYPSYEDFDAHCVDARGVRDTELVANPTQRGRTAGSSALSPSGSTPRRPSSKQKVPK